MQLGADRTMQFVALGWSLLVLGMTFTMSVSAQQATSRPVAAKSEIAGIVRDSISGAGIPGVTVRTFLMGPAPVKLEVKADDAGRFVFRDIPDGQYELSVHAEHFGSGVSRISVTNALRKVVSVKSGLIVPPVQFLLERGASISGFVMDIDKAPVSGAKVYALILRPEKELRMRAVETGASAVSGKDGSFTLKDLPRGGYILGAIPPAEPPFTTLGTSGENQGVLTPAYHPSGSTTDSAVYVDVRPGEARTGANIVIRRSAAFTVVGTIRGLPSPGSIVSLTMMPKPVGLHWVPNIERRMGHSRPDGTYIFENVPSGEYRIGAWLRHDGQTFRATADISVSERNHNGPIIELERPFSLVGTVRLDDSAEKLAGTELTFDIVPVDHIWPWPEGIRATTDKQGRIQFDGVHEGEYWLFPIRLPNGSYVEKIRYGVVPANSSVIRVLNSSAMLEIGVNLNGGTISGRVLDSNGRVVPYSFVYIDGEGAHGRWSASVRCAQDGTYRFDGIPKGEFYLFSFENIERRRLSGEDRLLKDLRSKATRTELAQSQRKTMDLTVIAVEP